MPEPQRAYTGETISQVGRKYVQPQCFYCDDPILDPLEMLVGWQGKISCLPCYEYDKLSSPRRYQ